MIVRPETIVCALLVVACSANEPNAPSGGGGQGGSDPVASCENEKQALVELIEQNRACEIDEDCQALSSLCLYEGRVDCTGDFFVNMNVTEEEFVQVDDTHTACMQASSDEPDSECGTCLKIGWAPFCDDGICAASDEIAQ